MERSAKDRPVADGSIWRMGAFDGQGRLVLNPYQSPRDEPDLETGKDVSRSRTVSQCARTGSLAGAFAGATYGAVIGA
ncbi:hypothetical protein ACFL2H_12095, partial [Planctomycetota bacterium]